MNRLIQVKIDNHIFEIQPSAISLADRMLIEDHMERNKATGDFVSGILGCGLLFKYSVKSMKSKDGVSFLLQFDQSGLTPDSIDMILDFYRPTAAKLFHVAYLFMRGYKPTKFYDEKMELIEGIEVLTPTELLN